MRLTTIFLVILNMGISAIGVLALTLGDTSLITSSLIHLFFAVVLIEMEANS